MAGHLPIELDREHLKIIMQAIDLEIENQKPFERIKQKDDSFFQLLTKEYEMNEEHGKIDDLIFSGIKSGVSNKSFILYNHLI